MLSTEFLQLFWSLGIFQIIFIMNRRQQSLINTVNSRACATISGLKFKTSLSKYLIKKLALERVISADDPTCCAFCIKFSPDGRLLAWTAAEQIQIWDFDANKLVCLRTDHQEIVTSLAWLNITHHNQNSFRYYQSSSEETNDTPNAELLDDEDYPFFTCSLDKTIKFYRKFTPVATLTEHADWIRCLAVNSDNSRMISGCVSSQIMGWDIDTFKPVFSIQNAHFLETLKELNTINSLQFSQQNKNIFLSGARDGYIKIWDARMLGHSNNNNRAVISFPAHNAKLNSASWSYNDCFILTGGRDNAVRLWDSRKMSTQTNSKENQLRPLCEYTAHHCNSYNVACCFFNNEQHIATGSENSRIYIYDTWSGELVKKLKITSNSLTLHPPVVHLLQSRYIINDAAEPTLVSSSINESSIQVWKPRISKTKKIRNLRRTSASHSSTTAINLDDSSDTLDSDSENEDMDRAEDPVAASQRAVIEELMKKHGDQILRLFHKYNFTFSSQQDWNQLIQTIQNNPNNDDNEIVHVVNEIASDFAKLFLVQQQQQRLADRRLVTRRPRRRQRRLNTTNSHTVSNVNNETTQRRRYYSSANLSEEASNVNSHPDPATTRTNTITTTNANTNTNDDANNNDNGNNNNNSFFSDNNRTQTDSGQSHNPNSESQTESGGRCNVQ
jgi:WD40 repeat protein